MRGAFSAVCRTALVGGGVALLGVGIVTLALPDLLSAVGVGETGTSTGLLGLLWSETARLSLRAIVWGLTVVAAGLALPGRSAFGLVGEQPFTARQRLFVWTGAALVVGLPAARRAARTVAAVPPLVSLAVSALSLLGAVLVLLGTSGGLQQTHRRSTGRRDQNS